MDPKQRQTAQGENSNSHESHKTAPRKLSLEWLSGIDRIDRTEWNTLALPADTPFLEWEWLELLESSRSVCPETGWQPCHLTLKEDGVLVAAAPLYIKWHSAGEFVWDYVWADVADQLKVDYYPKLVGMSPATPSVGYRFLFAEGEDEELLSRLMLEQIEAFCRRNGINSSAFNFVAPAWRRHPLEYGYVPWKHQSYLWKNPGYSSFDDYLASFRKNQRRNIRRERASMVKADIHLRVLAGEEIPEHYFSLMWRLYEKTNDQFGPWAAKYLTKDFFTGLYDRFRSRLAFACAFENQDGLRSPAEHDPIAIAFLVVKGDLMVGRYWGTFQDLRDLHFNACYYSPIEWAIEHNIRLFDPGAGSPHKLRRGFEAVDNFSLHKFVDPTMDAVMKNYIEEINESEQDRIDEMNRSIPWKQNPS